MKPLIFDRNQIEEALVDLNPIEAIEEGFIAYSEGKVVVPPVGELSFDDPPGDMHIKYGCITGDDYHVVKIASGFYDNYRLGLPNGTGLMLLFSQKTGELIAILLDEGHLTDVRTAAAGAVTARYLAPEKVERIGIVGAGVQGRMQLEYLRSVVDCTDVTVWGINQEEVDLFAADMEPRGYSIETTLDAGEVGANCNLIVTATPSTKPLLLMENIRAGTHITAMGSDTLVKQELDTAIVAGADFVVVDSIEQCCLRGECFKAMEAGVFNREQMVELGRVIVDPSLHRSSDDQITVADLTGVAVQDIQICKAVFEVLNK